MSKYQVVEVINSEFCEDSYLSKKTGAYMCEDGDGTPWFLSIGKASGFDNAFKFSEEMAQRKLSELQEYEPLKEGWIYGINESDPRFIEVCRMDDDKHETYWVFGYATIEIKE